MNDLYHDYRTGGRTCNYMVFAGESGDASYSREYFAAHSEHVTLESPVMLGLPYRDYAYKVTSRGFIESLFYGWAGEVQS